MNKILKRIATQYFVHEDHDEVTQDMDGSMNDHLDLLEDDQNCIEKNTNITEDSSNEGDCQCDSCMELETAASMSRLYKRIA